MKELLRLAAAFILFAVAVCGFAAIAYHAEEESDLIHSCRASLAQAGLENVEVVCRGTSITLRATGLSRSDKLLAINAVRTLEGVSEVAFADLLVASAHTFE